MTENSPLQHDATPRLSLILTRLDNLPAIEASELATHPRETPLVVLDTNVLFDIWYWNDKDAQALKSAIFENRTASGVNPKLSEGICRRTDPTSFRAF